MTNQELKILFKSFKFCVVGRRIVDFIALSRFISFELVIVTDSSTDNFEMLLDTNLISPVKNNSEEIEWRNYSINRTARLFSNSVLGLVNEISPTINVLLYSSCFLWEEICVNKANGLMYLPVPFETAEKVDNKYEARRNFNELGIQTPDFVFATISEFSFDDLVSLFGDVFLVQEQNGTSGFGTYFVRSREEFLSLNIFEKNKKLLISKYVGTTCINIHGLVANKEVYVSAPSVQVTGVSELTTNWAGYCGNDFGAASLFSREILCKIRELTKRIGYWLRNEGYFGLFGLDMIVQGQEVFVLEVNPRMQGSTWLLSELELKLNLVPFVIYHLIQTLLEKDLLKSFDFDEKILENAQCYPNGAFVIIHNTENLPVKICQPMKGGIYALEKNTLKLCSTKFDFVSMREDEVLFFGIAIAGFSVKPGAVLARFASNNRLVESDGRSMTDFGKKIVCAFKQHVMVS